MRLLSQRHVRVQMLQHALSQVHASEVLTVTAWHAPGTVQTLSFTCYLHRGSEGRVRIWVHGITHIRPDVQPGSIEGQLGALRHIRLGSLGFVEQLEAMDDDRLTM